MYKNLITTALFLVTTTSVFAQPINDPDVFWRKVPVSIPVSGAAPAQKSSFQQVMQQIVIQHNLYDCSYVQDPVVGVKPGICYDTVCQGGAGKSPAWDAFYSAKKEEKANRLADAIQGVGKASAEKLILGGYFNSKPKTWQAFKAAINQATMDAAITSQVQGLVLSTYRNENMSKLGYNGGCTSTEYQCDEVYVITPGYYVQQTCDNPVEKVIQNKPMTFEFEVENSVLLPSESENLIVNVSGELSEITLNKAHYNSYQFSVEPTGPQSASISISGTGRYQVSLPSNAIQSVGLVPVDGKSATLQISVHPGVLPAAATEQLVVSYEVKSCKIGFLGVCGPGWDKKQAFTGTLTNAISNFAVSSDLVGKKGLKMEVDVKIYKQNSVYHNTSPASKSTSTIKLK
jgi:hypothetical protein